LQCADALPVGWGIVTHVEIRPLMAGDDLDPQLDLAQRAFGVLDPAARAGWLARTAQDVAAGRFLAAFDGTRQVGGAFYHDMRQWWNGRCLPMAGVAGVKIAPEVRGQGVGRLMMAEVLRHIAARGYPLSALYPATMPIYRSLGWELAGGRHDAVVPARSLRSLAPGDLSVSPGTVAVPALRRATADDAADIVASLGRAHQAARDCGPITVQVAAMREWMRGNPEVYNYIGEDSVLSYQWGPANDGLVVHRAVAATPQAVRAQLAVLAGHSSTAGEVELRVSPHGPLWWLLRERDARLVKRSMWMLRVVDAEAAIEQRGFGAAVAGTAALQVADEAMGDNAGPWTLTVEGGKGRLERAEAAPGDLTLGARGLAALYAGTPVATLRLAGLAAGGTPDDDAFLSAAFPGPAWMHDDF
jgi:GNAT superfamily N-acetyltransferase